jgi:SAM-dependent methyltransferase
MHWLRRTSFKSGEYWENRYASGGNSGVGSFGKLARYKAEVLNSFIEDHGINTVLELGCGDGNQLLHYKIRDYIGVDVSPTAIKLCQERFAGDTSKRFFIYDRELRGKIGQYRADLAISVDVIYHLVEDDVLSAHIDDLFGLSSRFVIIYSTNFDRSYRSPHQVDRQVASIIQERRPDFELIDTITNPYKGSETASDFFVYERLSQSPEEF